MMMEANINNIYWIFYRVKEWFMRYNNEVFVKYRIDKNSIVFGLRTLMKIFPML